MEDMILGVWGVLLALVLLTASVGCNTMQGMGQDIEKAGQKIEETAD
ncbi:MAG: entericidin A/B family lipoprotein [Desulfovermiculus sp.]